jgi:hypothetical protein
LGDIWRSVAVNSHASIAVMIIKVTAEAVLAYFKAQVSAGGYDAGFGKIFNNCGNTGAPLGGDLSRNFEWRLIYQRCSLSFSYLATVWLADEIVMVLSFIIVFIV